MITQILSIEIVKALQELYSATDQNIQFQKTRKDFDGDITLVVFPLLIASKKGAEQTAEEIGNFLKEKVDEVSDFNVVKGFLNLEIAKSFWFNQFLEAYNTADYGVVKADAKAPTIKDTAMSELESSLPEFATPRSTATAITKTANIRYSAFKNAIAPSAILAPICFIRSVPSS